MENRKESLGILPLFSGKQNRIFSVLSQMQSINLSIPLLRPSAFYFCALQSQRVWDGIGEQSSSAWWHLLAPAMEK